jgi:hypothetical protein
MPETKLGADVMKTLGSYQLKWMIQRGRHVEECKEEWRKRWALEYPFYKSASGIKEME